ncbi:MULTISPECIES: DMT family protein [Symbiopectobacterium]
MSPLFITVGMLTLSNVFMTFAWYGHLRYFSGRTWLIAALVSWGNCIV